MTVLFADSIFWKDLPGDFQKRYEQEVTATFLEVRKILPDVSEYVNFVVQPRTYDLIEETQDSGYTVNSELVQLAFHPQPEKGHEAMFKHIRPTVFHELNHTARYNQGIRHESLLEQSIMEGLATAFERDYADATPQWGKYKPVEARRWLKEIQELGSQYAWNDYMYKHPDGRQWIGYRTGTYIVDEATKHSSKTIPELVPLSCEEILKLAKLII